MYRDKLLLKHYRGSQRTEKKLRSGNYHDLQCPECFKLNNWRLRIFPSPKAISNHIVKNHQIAYDDLKTIKKLVKEYQKSDSSHFLKFCVNRGYLK